MTTMSSFLGVPICACLIFIIELTSSYSDITKHDEAFALVSNTILFWQCVYLVVGAVFMILNQILISLALIDGDTSQISVILSIDLVFVFLFQYVVIGVGVNWEEVVGAVLIFAGTFLIALLKLIEPQKIESIVNSSFVGKILFFKF